MSDHEADAARVLDQVVDVGPTTQETALGAAVSWDILNRPTRREPDPEMPAALRALAATASAEIANVEQAAISSPLMVTVDFNALLADVGEPGVWEILGKLKDMFG
jgi:hypothetical protein